MASLGTIALKGGSTDGMSDSEIGNLISHKDGTYVYFSFLDKDSTPAPAESTKTNILLEGIDRDQWQRFETHCQSREGKKAYQKINEMISEYNRKTDG